MDKKVKILLIILLFAVAGSVSVFLYLSSTQRSSDSDDSSTGTGGDDLSFEASSVDWSVSPVFVEEGEVFSIVLTHMARIRAVDVVFSYDTEVAEIEVIGEGSFDSWFVSDIQNGKVMFTAVYDPASEVPLASTGIVIGKIRVLDWNGDELELTLDEEDCQLGFEDSTEISYCASDTILVKKK